MNPRVPNIFARKKYRVAYEKGNPKKLVELVEQLRVGTYGTIWRAREKKTGGICAVKIISVDDDLGEIERHIAILKDCDSQYIVKFYGKLPFALYDPLEFYQSCCHITSIFSNFPNRNFC